MLGFAFLTPTYGLIGIPHRLVLGDKGLAKGVIEYKGRRDKAAREVPLGQIINTLRETIKL